MSTRSLGYEHTCPRCKKAVLTEGCAPPEGWMKLTLSKLQPSEPTEPHRAPWEDPFASAVFCAPCSGFAANQLGLELEPK